MTSIHPPICALKHNPNRKKSLIMKKSGAGSKIEQPFFSRKNVSIRRSIIICNFGGASLFRVQCIGWLSTANNRKIPKRWVKEEYRKRSSGKNVQFLTTTILRQRRWFRMCDESETMNWSMSISVANSKVKPASLTIVECILQP